MPRTNLEDLLARVAAHSGQEPHAVTELKPGAVFLVEDSYVWFADAAHRTTHDQRHVAVVQAKHLLFAGYPDSVLVVPCSSLKSDDKPGPTEVLLDGEKAFSKRTVAIAHLVMPIGKQHFKAGKFKGHLSDEAYGRVRGAVARCLNLTGSV